MKKVWILPAVLAMVLACAVCSVADVSDGLSESGSCGSGAIFTLDEETGAMTISGSGDMSKYNRGQAPWYAYRESIKTLAIDEGITSVGDWAFYGCTSLTTVALAGTVKDIGVEAFNGCANLKSVSGGEGVTIIENGAFFNCTGLSDYKIGSRVVTIAKDAFQNCASLTAVIIPDSVEYVNSGAFANCKALEVVTLGSGVKYIGDKAFDACEALKAITVDSNNGVFSSEGGVLFNKDKTELLLYPIGASEVCNLPSSVTSFDQTAFDGCTGLKSIVVDPNSSSFSSKDGILYDKAKTELIFCPRGSTASVYVIPESVKTIADGAFSTCTNLTSIIFGGNVETVGDGAFLSCPGLLSVTMYDSVKTIGNNAFFQCMKLMSITFGDGVETVGSNLMNQTLYDTDGKTVLSPTADNVRGSAFELRDGGLVKVKEVNSDSTDSDDGSSFPTAIVAVLIVVVILVAAMAVYLKRRNA